jgi:hypothetical protein
MFNPKTIYKRSTIHDQYGGSRQSGICPSAKFPYIFIFTGSGGSKHGYKDQWENSDVFSYTGEGQAGDMEFTKGNLALKDHLVNGKRVFLFKYVQKGFVEYVSEMEVVDCDYFMTHDTSGKERLGIKFFFKRAGVNLYKVPMELQPFAEPEEPYGIILPNKTERQGLVTSRVGQGAYRKSILHRWQYQCAVTKFNDSRVLVASHIVPWKDSDDNERLDVENGILLSPDYDALFDKHLISFENNGKIILSDDLDRNQAKVLGITGMEEIRQFSAGNKEYLERHRLKLG